MDEGLVAALSDDEDALESGEEMEYTVIGKVLWPASLHITTIRNAMRPAWGNPFGLKLRSVGEKSENLFIA